MNPLLASPGLSTRAGQDVDLRFLEDLLNDDCKCGSSHEGIPCSKDVVAWKTVNCLSKEFMICENSYRWNKSVMADPSHVCGRCFRDNSDCWEIRPI